MNNAAGTSVYINGLQSAGDVAFDDLTIGHRNGTGMLINNSSGTVDVSGTLTVTNKKRRDRFGPRRQQFVRELGLCHGDRDGRHGLAGRQPGERHGNHDLRRPQHHQHEQDRVYANNAGTLTINDSATPGSGGTITTTNGTAIDLENTALNVYPDTVNVTGGTVSIKLINTTGYFAVLGDANEDAGSGGTIQGATTAILLQNVGTVGLIGMNLTGNGVGIQATTGTYVGLYQTQVTNSTSYRINALDVNTLQVMYSTFSGNGANNVAHRYDAVNTDAVTVNNSTFTSSVGDNLLVQYLNGSQSSTMTLDSEQNTFTNNQAGTAAIRVNWNGSLTATVDQTTTTGTGGSNLGVQLNNQSLTGSTTATITNNTLTATAATIPDSSSTPPGRSRRP